MVYTTASPTTMVYTTASPTTGKSIVGKPKSQQPIFFSKRDNSANFEVRKVVEPRPELKEDFTFHTFTHFPSVSSGPEFPPVMEEADSSVPAALKKLMAIADPVRPVPVALLANTQGRSFTLGDNTGTFSKVEKPIEVEEPSSAANDERG